MVVVPGSDVAMTGARVKFPRSLLPSKLMEAYELSGKQNEPIHVVPKAAYMWIWAPAESRNENPFGVT